MKKKMPSSNERARPSAAFAGLDPPDAASLARCKAHVALWRCSVSADRLQFRRQNSEKSKQNRLQSRHHRQPERSHRRLVEDVRHLWRFAAGWAYWFADSLRDYFVSGYA